MIDATGDFPGQEACRQFAQQAWNAWFHAMPVTASPMPAAGWPGGQGHGGADTLLRGMAGLKSYFDWMQGVSGQMPLPFAHLGAAEASPGFDPAWMNALAEPLGRAWKSFGDMGQAMGGNAPWQPMAPLGLWREQQLEENALAAAMRECAETARRYQEVWQKIFQGAAARLSDRLARRAESGTPLESLRALYDVWVDAAEESFADVALSVEFREAYGALSNAQMKLRALQQKQLEAWCRELGLPTREELASLGQRVQELRRELRGQGKRARRAKPADEPAQQPGAATEAKAFDGAPTVKPEPMVATPKRHRKAAAKTSKPRTRRTPAVRAAEPAAAAKKHVATAVPKKKVKHRKTAASGRPSIFAQAIAQQRRPVRVEVGAKRRHGKRG